MEYSFISISIFFILLSFMRRRKDGDSFFLGSKDGGILSISLSISATWIGSTTLFVLSIWVYRYGSAATWYLIAPGIGLILLGIFGVDEIRKKKGDSLAEYFTSKGVSQIVRISIFIIYTLFIAAQLVGFAKLSTVFNFSYTFGLFIGASVVGIYVLIGGFNSVRDTDVIQLLLVITAMFVLFIGLSTDELDLATFSPIFSPLDFLPSSTFIFYLTLGSLMFIAQDNHQRIKASKNSFTAKCSCINAGVLIIIYALSIAALVSTLPPSSGNPIIENLSRLGPASLIIVSTGILAAALSSADSALNISSYSLSSLKKNWINEKS